MLTVKFLASALIIQAEKSTCLRHVFDGQAMAFKPLSSFKHARPQENIESLKPFSTSQSVLKQQLRAPRIRLMETSPQPRPIFLLLCQLLDHVSHDELIAANLDRVLRQVSGIV